MRRVVEAIILNEKNEVLLQKKSLDYPLIPNSGHWSVFGGSIERDETPEKAINRELTEELGIEFKDIQLWKVKEFNHPIIKTDVKSHIFLVKLNKPLSKLSILEGAGIAFFDKSELKNIKIDPIIQKNLKELFNEL